MPSCRRVLRRPPCRGIVGVRRSLQPPMPSCRRARARRLSSQPRCRAARRTVPISNLAPSCPPRDRPPVRAKARMGGQTARDSALAGGHRRLEARRHACRRVRGRRPCRGMVGVRRFPELPMPSCRRAWRTASVLPAALPRGQEDGASRGRRRLFRSGSRLPRVCPPSRAAARPGGRCCWGPSAPRCSRNRIQTTIPLDPSPGGTPLPGGRGGTGRGGQGRTPGVSISMPRARSMRKASSAMYSSAP